MTTTKSVNQENIRNDNAETTKSDSLKSIKEYIRNDGQDTTRKTDEILITEKIRNDNPETTRKPDEILITEKIRNDDDETTKGTYQKNNTETIRNEEEETHVETTSDASTVSTTYDGTTVITTSDGPTVMTTSDGPKTKPKLLKQTRGKDLLVNQTLEILNGTISTTKTTSTQNEQKFTQMPILTTTEAVLTTSTPTPPPCSCTSDAFTEKLYTQPKKCENASPGKIIFQINDEENIELNINSKQFIGATIVIETSFGTYQTKFTRDPDCAPEPTTETIPMKRRKQCPNRNK